VAEAEPVPEQILAAVVARLKTITPGNGYRLNLHGRVFRRAKTLEEMNELPVAIVFRAEGSPEHVYDELAGAGTLGVGETGELIKAFLDVDVWLYTQGSDSLEPSTAWERLAADAEEALTKDLHLGLSPDVVWDVRKVGNVDFGPVPPTWTRVEGTDRYRVAYQYERGQP
jgi:hypothetical protein